MTGPKPPFIVNSMLLCPAASHSSPTSTSCDATSFDAPFATSVNGPSFSFDVSSRTSHHPSAAVVASARAPPSVTVTRSPGSPRPHTAVAASRCTSA